MDEWTEGVLLGIVCGIIVGVFIYAAIDPHNVSEPPQQEWIEEEVCVEWEEVQLPTTYGKWYNMTVFCGYDIFENTGIYTHNKNEVYDQAQYNYKLCENVCNEGCMTKVDDIYDTKEVCIRKEIQWVRT